MWLERKLLAASPYGNNELVAAGPVFNYNSSGNAYGNGANPESAGVISGGIFNGYIIANNNDGTVGLIDPTGLTETVIASGGTRGDFTSPDGYDGSLLLSEYGAMYRLRSPENAFVNVISAPEPGALTMLGIGVASLAAFGWRRRKQA